MQNSEENYAKVPIESTKSAKIQIKRAFSDETENFCDTFSAKICCADKMIHCVKCLHAKGWPTLSQNVYFYNNISCGMQYNMLK